MLLGPSGTGKSVSEYADYPGGGTVYPGMVNMDRRASAESARQASGSVLKGTHCYGRWLFVGDEAMLAQPGEGRVLRATIFP